jgi:hypothetical protein
LLMDPSLVIIVPKYVAIISISVLSSRGLRHNKVFVKVKVY